MLLASVLFCGKINACKYIRFNTAFGKLSLKKVFCSSTERVLLLLAKADE